jgi:hypothetical protein
VIELRMRHDSVDRDQAHSGPSPELLTLGSCHSGKVGPWLVTP